MRSTRCNRFDADRRPTRNECTQTQIDQVPGTERFDDAECGRRCQKNGGYPDNCSYYVYKDTGR